MRSSTADADDRHPDTVAIAAWPRAPSSSGTCRARALLEHGFGVQHPQLVAEDGDGAELAALDLAVRVDPPPLGVQGTVCPGRRPVRGAGEQVQAVADRRRERVLVGMGEAGGP